MSFAEKFNLLNGIVLLRIMCGAFFIPHIYAKFFVPEALGFFVAAKFQPPAFWMYTACVIETILAIADRVIMLDREARGVIAEGDPRRPRALASPSRRGAASRPRRT